MKQRTAKSMELYEMMLKRGYPEVFCEQITLNLNTDWTEQRMIGYLSHYKKLPMEDVADEMLAILPILAKELGTTIDYLVNGSGEEREDPDVALAIQPLKSLKTEKGRKDALEHIKLVAMME